MENQQESPTPRIQQKSPTTSPMKKPPEKSKQKHVAAKRAQSHTLGNQQESSTAAGNQRKSPTSSLLKRPVEISTHKQSTAKRVKSSTMESQHTSSQLKRSAEKSKEKQPAAKRFKPPMASKQLKSPVAVVTRSPMMRLVVSPVVMGPRSPAHNLRASPTLPSLATGRSPSPSASPPPYLAEESGAAHDLDDALRGLYNSYSAEMEVSTCSDHRHEGASTTSGGGKSWSDWSNHMSAHSSNLTDQLDRYIRDDLFPCDDDSFDILDWWKMHSSKYPVVARMARDVLAAPASTVASESAFSTSERIINDHRTRLSGNTMEALICFQNWLREAGSSYLDIIKIDSLGVNFEEGEAAA